MSFETITKSLDAIERNVNERMAEHADRLLQLEQRNALPRGDGSGSAGKTYGQLAFEMLQKNMDLLGKTRSVRLELKAAGDPVTTTSGRMIVSGRVGVPSGRVLGLQYGLPQRPASGTSAVEYSRFTGTQGAAAQQAAEGDAKAAVRPDHTLITQSALTVAGHTKIARQALNDSQQLSQAVNVTLQRSVDIATDGALVNGATGFTGGIEGLATAYTSLLYDTLVDATSEGVATMQTAGFSPDVVALNPADWLAITVSKGGDGHYLMAGSFLSALPSEMRGLRVVLSPSVDAGKSLLLDTAHIELLIVDGFTVEFAYSGDDFTKNLITALGEVRVIPTFLAVGAARLITPL